MILNDYLNKGIKNITATAKRYYMVNLKGQAFLLHMTSSLRRGARTREKFERVGTHIPPFLITSIATGCNLRCAGCYAGKTAPAGTNRAVSLTRPTGGAFSMRRRTAVYPSSCLREGSRSYAVTCWR